MKKSSLILLLITSIFFIGCERKESKNCNENIEFKDAFMSSVSKIEEYTSGKGTRKDFDNSLKFLSKYVKVSFEDMMNYSNEYTNINVFKKDKENWLKWYEEQKCNYIKFQ
ncbi:hypothetical protein [uncultured Kordia sp.]|uniref:hypothetical protein n=1 Tax=uncultured Kordia sp. TaxID=507699 RepID=UPI0026034F52|nr:hypothetical protein [uncultured Kordia sp.]